MLKLEFREVFHRDTVLLLVPYNENSKKNLKSHFYQEHILFFIPFEKCHLESSLPKDFLELSLSFLIDLRLVCSSHAQVSKYK